MNPAGRPDGRPDPTSVFSGRRITVMGLGLLGRGAGDSEFLARHGARLTVTDLKPAEDLRPSVERLTGHDSVTLVLGRHRLEDFEDRELILKGAGVPLDSPFVAHARAHGVPVDMSASLFARVAPNPIVGVTGTRGKSTVTHLLEAIFRTADVPAVLGGNVRGMSTLALLDEVSTEAVGIFELDSWQLQGFGEERSLEAPGVRQGPLSPRLAVFTSFMADHLNYYRGDLDRYLDDKAQIFRHQRSDDLLVVGRQAADRLRARYRSAASRMTVADASDVPAGWRLRLLGPHNRYNAGCAVVAARLWGLDEEAIRAAVEGFAGLPGRLERVAEIGGVEVYNDTNATTPDAVAAALSAMDERPGATVLIAGGTAKGLDPTPLIEAANARAKAVVLLPGTGTDALDLGRLRVRHVLVETLEQALDTALDEAQPGDAVLFSPGFASFGMFRNEYHRGEAFDRLVRARR